MIEPNVIQKISLYIGKRHRNQINPNLNINDSQVTYSDLRSNDLWCIGYLMLILLDGDFISCYSFNHTNKKKLTSFDSAKFLVLYKNLCGQQLVDENMVYVLNTLLGLDRFLSGIF